MCSKINVNKNNFDVVLVDFSFIVSFGVKDMFVGDGSEIFVRFEFCNMKDFYFEQVVKKILQFFKLLVMCNFLKDLKFNLLDNVMLCCEFEGVVKDEKIFVVFKSDLDVIVVKIVDL